MPRQRRTVPWLDWRNGVAYACWYDAENRRTRKLSLGTRDAAEAQARFAAFLTQGSDQYGASPKGMTLSQCLQFYFDEHVDPPQTEQQRQWSEARDLMRQLGLSEPAPPPRPGVVDKQRAYLSRRYLEEHAGDVAIADIDVFFCRDYTRKRQESRRKASLTTISREIAVIKAAVRHNIKWNRLTEADEPTLEYPAGVRRRECWLFKDEIKTLREAADEETRDLVDVIYYTGSRRRAIETLEWSQVDLTNWTIRLAKPGERKTKKRRPTVPVVPQLQPVLTRRYLERANGFVFGSDKRRFNQVVRVAKLAGVYELPERDGRPADTFTIHALRHSRATHMLQDGVDIYAVAKLLGDTVSTIERIYGHAGMQAVADAVKRSEL